MTRLRCADPSRRDRPRERLLRLGGEALTDAELLAVLLQTGGSAGSALETAERALARHADLSGLCRASAEELVRSPGLGPARAAALRAAFELGRRIATRRLPEGTAVRDPADVFRHFHARLRDAARERFVCLLLDGRHRLLREELVSQGTLTASLVHPREVFRPALRAGAAALVLVHNHPSGDPTPSPEDREVTRRLARAGELLGVAVLDHVIVAERGFCSLREAGAFGD